MSVAFDWIQLQAEIWWEYRVSVYGWLCICVSVCMVLGRIAVKGTLKSMPFIRFFICNTKMTFCEAKHKMASELKFSDLPR